jgi:hypothetical protein
MRFQLCRIIESACSGLEVSLRGAKPPSSIALSGRPELRRIAPLPRLRRTLRRCCVHSTPWVLKDPGGVNPQRNELSFTPAIRSEWPIFTELADVLFTVNVLRSQ